MSLFHTGFNVDAAVPVASTSTTAHPSAGSVHKKRKRATSTGNDDEKSKSTAETAAAAATPNVPNGSAAPSTKKHSVMINADVDMSLSDSKNNSNNKSTEAVVNIEKLMKKLQRMEKGEKATKEEEKIAKKQKLQANGRDHTTPARGSNSIVTSKMNDKGKGKDKTTAGPAAEGSKKAKGKKDKKEKENKPEYIPDAEALAKREARIKKKELHAFTADAHKKSKQVASSGSADVKTANGETEAQEADASTMDIDTMEEVAQNAPSTTTTQPEVQADTPAAPVEKPTKKKNKKKEAQPQAVPEPVAESETASAVTPAPVPTPAPAPVAAAPVPTAPVAAGKSTKEVDSGMTDLQKRMQKKLGGARFRWINEQLYTTSGVDALQLMEEDPAMFEDYHNGFASQATSWPTQPIHLFIDQFKRLSTSKASTPKPIIADLGCGKAEIAQTLVPLGFTVLSYDLVEEEPYIVKAQCTKRLPLPGSGKTNPKGDNAEGAVVDHVVCCLSLMGNDWLGMIKESRRVLKMNGKLKIAEVTSRFTDVKDFIQLINAMGFKLGSKDESNTHFIIFEFEKIPLQTCKSSLLALSDEEKTAASQDLLKPCIYKRR